MIIVYGIEEMSECESIISDIEDMLLDLSDMGFKTLTGYTPMTLICREKNPRLIVEIRANNKLYKNNEDEVQLTIDRIKEYVMSFGYLIGDSSYSINSCNREHDINKIEKTYQMLIQK